MRIFGCHFLILILERITILFTEINKDKSVRPQMPSPVLISNCRNRVYLSYQVWILFDNSFNSGLIKNQKQPKKQELHSCTLRSAGNIKYDLS